MSNIGAWIKEFWGVLAAVVGICGAVYKYAISPYLKKRKEREDKLDKVLAEQTQSLGELKTALKELSKDVGFLQHDRLIQGHDHFMTIGYIPQHDLESLTTMYDRYTGQGRNSLFATYKQDLLNLPPAPDIEWGKRRSKETEH